MSGNQRSRYSPNFRLPASKVNPCARSLRTRASLSATSWRVLPYKVDYPIALDSDYAVWGAFANHFWPALYIADGQGRIRYHHFGEGEYAMSEMVVQQLLREAGEEGFDPTLASVDPEGTEVEADWGDLRTPETYL